MTRVKLARVLVEERPGEVLETVVGEMSNADLVRGRLCVSGRYACWDTAEKRNR